MIKGMSHMLAIINFDFLIQITCPSKMLHFDSNSRFAISLIQGHIPNIHLIP